MVVVLGLPLNVASIIIGCIFAMPISYFRAHGLIRIPALPIAALTEFSHADVETNVHPLSVSWYFISSLWRYLCSCMHIMSMLWSIAEAVSSVSWPILFKVLTLNDVVCIVLLHFSYFCSSLCSVAEFSNTGARAPALAGRTPFLIAWRAKRFGHMVWVWDMVILRCLYFILIHRSHRKIWAAVVPRSNHLILAVDPWDSSTQHQVRRAVDP